MDININELKKICIDFFNLAGTGFSLWDENRKNIFSYPEKHVPFCKAIRDNRKLYMKCAVSDKMGLDEVDRTKEPYIYTCHMGLTEAIVPILQDEEIVGYLMMGQIAEKEKIEDILRIIDRLRDSEEFKQRLIASVDEGVIYPHDKIEYCVNILKVLIDYMNLSYVFRKNSLSVYSRAKKYVSDNMSTPIKPSDICAHIGVSPSTLYKEIKKASGMSPERFIRKQKIIMAASLLTDTSAAVSEVAEKVGIPDVNYFIRVFRTELGMPPLRYRKFNKGEGK